ncbi:hypothetical protein [Streptomyces novaecaesareae]|uniref:hypothetical protein n=1 Tax=Streptomyces novaecaesareae TaxID=68244 RepID=UPI0006915770|nr:hypothetical protein [Streptomyces novaecaesareae]
MASTPPDFNAIADALYALAPTDFTATRNERADELKKSDPRLAQRIRALHRPTLAAWAANLLAHRHHDLVEQLIELGQALRDAQRHLASEQLRALTDRRRQLVQALTEQARQDAAAAGHPLGADAVGDVTRTLSAALADPDAARALAKGRLTAALEPPLWPGAAPSGAETDRDVGAPAGAAQPAARQGTFRKAAEPSDGQERSAARAEAARQRLREQEQAARETVAAAVETEREASGRAADADRVLRDAQSVLRRAQGETERARAELARAQEHEASAREDLAQAGERVRAAEDAARTAGGRAARSREAVRDAVERLQKLEARGRGNHTS